MNRTLTYFLSLLLVFLPFIAWSSASNPEAAKLYQEAEAAFKANDMNKAASLLNAALNKEPDNAVFRYIFAKVLLKNNNYILAKENLDVVAKSRPSQEKGEDYNNKLKDFKRKIKELQKAFNQEGDKKFSVYLKHQDSKDKIKLAVTLYEAFRLNPPLRYKNYNELKSATDIYEAATKGKEGLKGPMLQLAFLFEISNKKTKAAELYMKALDYVKDPNEEFVIIHKFDYLNRSNKEKLLDTIEAGEFTHSDIEELMGSDSAKIGEEDKKQINEMIAEAQQKLENASTEEEREAVLEEIKATILKKQKEGSFPGSEKLKEKLKKEGKTMEDYMKEQGL